MTEDRYCPSNKPLNEHDNKCYYHGPLQVCPYCGTVTFYCQEGIYTPVPGYTLRELGRPHTWRGHL